MPTFISRTVCRRAVLVLGGVILCAFVQPAAQTPSGPTAGASSSQRTVVTQYCTTCHNQRTRAGNLDLAALDPDAATTNPVVWEKVIRKLRARAMPPAGARRPDPATADGLVAALEDQLDRAAAARPNPGRTETFHRLNRTEYRNVVRDLLGVDVDVASLLPADDGSYGFDNIAGVLKLSSTLVDRYLSAARVIAGAALGTGDATPIAETYRVRSDFSQRDRVDGLPMGTRGGASFSHHFPIDAEYEFSLEVGGSGTADRYALELTIDRILIRTVAIGRQAAGADGYEAQPERGLKIRLPIAAGPHVVAATFVAKSAATTEDLYKPYLRSEAAGLPALDSITITGPFAIAGVADTPSRQRILTCRPGAAAAPRVAEETGCAKKILATLARRAYRRAVNDDDLEPLMRMFESGRSSGGFDAGIEMALRRLLVSPEFLLRVERDPAGTDEVYRISDVELASRLSFFLWSSIPDDELLDAAIRGTLSRPAVLERQVRRMIQDRRMEALARNFAGQWLYLRNLPQVLPDEALFPYFGENLRQDFQRETELFFESLLRENRSVLELLTADYTFVNERLAKHYGIPHVYGSRFRRVTLSDERRRGLLGQGSFLTVTSHPDRTSVVGRGKWILENLIGSPPPPPPPNVPALAETSGTGGALTLRERMAQHRSNPVCSGCHARMDPLGFALENFDATGQWRMQDGFQQIDASADLGDGTKFSGPAGLRDWLVGQPQQVVTTVTEKLLTYALGRGLEAYDAPAIRQIARAAANDKYSLNGLILGIVNSPPFQMRRRAASGN